MCLTKWVQSAAKKEPSKFADVISCPTCRESFPLPPGGVGSLRSNFFITKLKEKHSIEQKLDSNEVPISCTSCSAFSSGSAIARCVDCNDFFCADCITAHKKMRLLKDHKILTLDELRSGKLTMSNLPEQELCSKHKGEVLRYHCETCDEPTCRECMAIDHPQPQHKHVDLKTIATKRGSDLKELAMSCEEVLKEIKAALKDDAKLMSQLEANVKKAKSDHMWLAEELKSKILTMVAENSIRITENLQQAELKQKSDIEKHSKDLQVIKQRLEYVLKVAHQLTDNGSEHDLVTTYASLSSVLTELGKVKAASADKSLAVVKLEPIKEYIQKLGVLGAFTPYSNWVLEKEFEVMGDQSHVIADENSITVSNGASLYIFDIKGNEQAKIDAPLATPYGSHYTYKYMNGIAKNSDGLYFVASKSNVKILDPNKEPYNYTQLVGCTPPQEFSAVTLDEQDRVVVCEYTYTCNNDKASGSFIKIYKDGVCEKTLPLLVPASYRAYVALPADGNFVVSSSRGVHVYSPEGLLRYGFEQPEGEKVEFHGVCCTKYNEIFAATSAGIHRYSTKGEYLGVVTREVESAQDIALRDDDNELIVVTNNKVKVFRLN